MIVRGATRADYPNICALIRGINVFHVPHNDEAARKLATAHNLVIEDEGKVIGWVAFTPIDNTALLDIAMHPDYHGIWATRGLIRALCEYAFTHMNKQYIIAEHMDARTARLALSIGFVLTHSNYKGIAISVLTRQNFERKFARGKSVREQKRSDAAA